MSISQRKGLTVVCFGGTPQEITFNVTTLPADFRQNVLATIAVQRIMREISAGKTDTPDDRCRAVEAMAARWSMFELGKLEPESSTKAPVVTNEEITGIIANVVARARVNAELAKDPKSKMSVTQAIELFQALSEARQQEVAKQFQKIIKAEVRTLTMARTSKADY